MTPFLREIELVKGVAATGSITVDIPPADGHTVTIHELSFWGYIG